MFRTRLDFLMHLTNTSNTELGNITVFTPSYISRIRMGKRSLPHNSTFLESASTYLAARVVTKEQKESLCQAMHIPYFPPDQSVRIGLLRSWLSGGNAADYLGIASGSEAEQNETIATSAGQLESPHPMCIYYGYAGKRDAVLRLASEVVKTGKPQVLYSFRDSPDMDWMTEDSGYKERWKKALDSIEKAGNKYVMAVDRYVDIHTFHLGIDLYLPYLMRGSMDIVFYPRQRDNLFHLYFFVAAKTAAIVYAGTASQKETSPYLYITEQPAVRQYTTEIERLIQQCVGGLRTCSPGISSDFWRYSLTLDHFSNTAIRNYWNGPSAMTIPSCVVKSFSSRVGIHLPPMFYRFEERTETHLKTHPIYDYVCLPSPADVKQGKQIFSGSELLGISSLYYTSDEFNMHIRHLIYLLEHYDNYHLILLEGISLPGDTYLMDNGKMVIISREIPHTVRIDTEGFLSYAVADYFQKLTYNCHEHSREETIAALKCYL